MAVPALTPVTIPEAEFTETFPLTALHEPPLVKSLSITDKPIQTVVVPVIAEGKGLTVSTEVDIHPVASL